MPVSPVDAVPPREPYLVLERRGDDVVARGLADAVLGGEAHADGIRTPVGIHARWAWDGRVLEVTTDRYGFQPLFYAVRDDTLWLSPSIATLLAQGAPDDLDDAAIAVFLRIGVMLDADTPFRAIRAVPPGGLRWEAGRLTLAHRPPWPTVRSITREAALDEYAERFRAAVLRAPLDPARTVLPLTGGRDSRHVLLELCAVGAAPRECVTVRSHPPSSLENVLVANRLAGRLGLPHRIIEQPRDRCADEVEKNRQTGLTAFEHAWVLPLTRWLRAQADAGAPQIIYDGIAGDTLSEAKYMSQRRLTLLREHRVDDYVQEELGSEGYLPTALSPDAYRRFARELAVERLAAELRRHLDAPNPVASYRFWNRTRRAVAVAPFAMLARVATVRGPFLDDELVAFLGALPGELLVDRTFHTTVIARSHPHVADEPFENPAAPPRPAGALARRYAAGAARLLLDPRGRRDRLVRRTSLTARMAALAVTPGRGGNAIGLATLGVYLTQLEERLAR